MVRFNPWRTSGSQKCIGARPIFRAKANVISVAEVGESMSVMFHCPVVQAFVVPAKRRSAEAVACVRKYLVVASTARGCCWWIIRGMMAMVLISRPIQIRSQWEPINVIVVPRPRLRMRIDSTRGFISRGRILTNMVGVWAQKLN